MSRYADDLAKLTVREMKAAEGNAAREAEVLERLVSSAAFTVALMARGNKKAADELLTGVESHLYVEAGRFGRLFGLMPKRPPAASQGNRSWG